MEDQWANADNVLQNKFLKKIVFTHLQRIFFTPVILKNMKKTPRYNETSLQRTNFASPLVALRYIEVPL